MGCTITRNHRNSSGESNLIKTSSMHLKSIIFEKTHMSHLSDYISLDFLGVGAFGEVLSAKHIPTSACRALKIIRKNGLTYNQLKSKGVLRESAVLSKLNHHKIIKFYEMLEDHFNFYIVTELCEGGNLGERLKKLHKFTEEATLEIMKQVLEAVQYLHSKNIVHRDIKLENILLTDSSSNNIKIADFGCSHFIQPGETLKNCCGSLYYLAPEVINENYTEKADIWSCGILALIMLTGVIPCLGISSAEIRDKIRTIKSYELIEKISNVSFGTQDLVRNMLETDANKRITAESAGNHFCFKKANQVIL
ncbi:hypothetical protein SteCoe_25526 [Stentor coeruleus]|uniref:Protein kinase domain-containing protein n=1 Tax=Stentor coeruleus TaxID=5963 RepID=A0A1R2BEX6_9CILI|nr:hypothetical protein SteCoe_25526 [Stentor coeruleus]